MPDNCPKNSASLTIAIPTYNRPEELATTLRKLLAQCPADVTLLIVDNASTTHIEEYIRNEFPDLPPNVNFHRNRANVGLVGNICRCYELAETRWIWTIGDDDLLEERAIDCILQEIAAHADNSSLLGINFSTSLFTYPKNRILHNLEDYWEVHQEPMAFSNALFLASCVFQTHNVLKYVRIGYQQAVTAASHIAIPLAALCEGHSMAIASSAIMKLLPTDESEGWNWVSVFAGMPILAEMPHDSVTIRGISKPLGYFAPGLRLRSGFNLLFSNSSRDVSYWYIYYSRLVPCLQGKRLWIALFYRTIAGLFFKLPTLRKITISILSKFGFEQRDSAQGASRL
jgi:glycosyltransferase involved in cell wall biosynthesis